VQFKLNFILLTLISLLIHACLPLPEDNLMDINMDINSSEVKAVYELQDRLESDSLIALLSNEDATIRYWAAKAFSSIQDKKAIPALTPLLNDTVPEIQQITAYALGQTADPSAEKALVAAFDQADAKNPLNRYILEAIGKSASAEYLPLISSVSTYQKQDTQLLEGQAYGIYYFGRRRITHPSGTQRMLDLVKDTEHLNKVRLIAANYLSRNTNIGLDTLSVDTLLSNAFSSENDPRTRMALAIALGQTKTPLAQNTLLQKYENETDYRVQCNIIRALSNFDYISNKKLIFNALRNPNLHIANVAVQYLGKNGSSREANTYRRLAKDTTLHPQIQIGLIEAANQKMPNYFVDYKGRITYDLQQKFEQATDPYLKAQALRAMGYYPRIYKYIGDLDLSDQPAVVKTAQMEALRSICASEDYTDSFGASLGRANRAIGAYLLQGLKSRDVGMVAAASGALRIPERDFKTILADSLAVLEAALAAHELPKEIESYNELKRTIAHFKGEEVSIEDTKHTHPIDWDLVAQLSAATRATIQTSKGTITLRFFPELAPASVANFVELAQSGYFNNKNFHRVVPNFVIQGGCNRGDGYGSEDYNIRSEFPPIAYERPGMVGMASAGKHTEGTQFFITHSPTLHLNGRYTIFAEVVDGMKVVDNIQVGDLIEKVEISGLAQPKVES